jgi:hypothetical protein
VRSTPQTAGVAIVIEMLQPRGSPSPLCNAKESGELAAAPDRQANMIVALFGDPVDSHASPFAKAWPAYAVAPAATQPAYDP